MGRSSKYIILTGVAIGCMSMLYWIGLLLHIPFFVTCILALAACFFLFRWMGNDVTIPASYPAWSWAIFIIGIVLITRQGYTLAAKHGDWDAWGIWNMHAHYLADPAYWPKIFQNVGTHADYPLCLPATLAFFNRLFAGHFSLIIPFAFSFLIMLCIPVLVYLETQKKNIVIAACALYCFSQDAFFIAQGVTQYADTLLGFFFMAALMCINYAQEDKRMITLTIFLLGCCAWTKNEGLVLAALFIIFYARTLFSKENLNYLFAGIGLPLVAWVTFKNVNPVHNDLLQKQSINVKQLLLDKTRYKAIYDSFKLNLNEKFNYLKIGVYIYAIICIIEKRLPNKQMLLVLTCLLAYMGIYVVTPLDLNWHLFTSQDRLMHQLMPAMVYVLANKFSEIEFSLPGTQKIK